LATHEELRELVAPAALGALEEPGRRELDAHLRSCAECREELRSLSDAAASLAFAARPVTPPAELRSRLLTSLKTTPQDRPAAERSEADGGVREARAGSPVVSLDEARRARTVVFSRQAFASGAIAASLLVAALAASTVMLWQRNGAMRAEVAALSSALERTRTELGQTRTDLASARSAVDLLAAPDARSAALAGTEMAEGARARITYDERTGEAMLTAANLPAAPAGKAYQLWYIAKGKPPMPGSVFTTDARGRAEMHDTIPPGGRRQVVFAVTLEPSGGVPAPTGQMYLKSES
jgi:anti-sigma-K factor RskA